MRSYPMSCFPRHRGLHTPDSEASSVSCIDHRSHDTVLQIIVLINWWLANSTVSCVDHCSLEIFIEVILLINWWLANSSVVPTNWSLANSTVSCVGQGSHDIVIPVIIVPINWLLAHSIVSCVDHCSLDIVIQVIVRGWLTGCLTGLDIDIRSLHCLLPFRTQLNILFNLANSLDGYLSLSFLYISGIR